MTKHQTAVMDKLKSVCEEATSLKIRLLIDCELSGKLWIYCDAKDKRAVLRLLRKNRITNRKRIFAEGYNTRFLNPYPSFIMREINKGKVRKLERIRPCINETIGCRRVWFYDLKKDRINRLKSTVCSLSDFEDMRIIVDEHFPGVVVNYSGDDIMFYGR